MKINNIVIKINKFKLKQYGKIAIKELQENNHEVESSL